MKRVSIFLLFSMIFTGVLFAKTTVVYPNLEGIGEKSLGYEVLKLALSKVEEDYEVKILSKPMNGLRIDESLDKGVISVTDGGIDKYTAEEYDFIYKPIDMGLLGWRVFIINKNSKNDFAKIDTLDQLKKKMAGQGTGWSDIAIIENAGIKVMTAPKIDFLIKMVEGQRFDFFPLGANEAHGFLDKFGKNSSKLMIEEHVTMVYPFGRFFKVKKGNTKLRNDIELGLERAFDDNSFQDLVLNHPFFKGGLEKSKLEDRVVIKIDNPTLPDEFYDIDSKWWFKVK